MKNSKTLPVKLRGDQRRIYIGKTRSGKSVKARQDLKVARLRKWRIVIVDPKRDWMGRGKERRPYADEKSLGTVDNPRLVTEFDPSLAVQIIHPVQWDDSVEKFLKAIMVAGYTIVYFDEITQLVTASFVPIAFAVLWTQGGALYVSAWCTTQFPRRIPIIVMDQAEIWYIFRVLRLEDRKTIGEYIPVEETPELVAKPLPVYWFWFWEDTMPKPVLVRPVKMKAA